MGNPTAKTCGNCRFGVPPPGNTDKLVVLQCRRYPPGGNAEATGWAAVQPTDWCGEYATKTGP